MYRGTYLNWFDPERTCINLDPVEPELDYTAKRTQTDLMRTKADYPFPMVRSVFFPLRLHSTGWDLARTLWTSTFSTSLQAHLNR